MRHRIGKNWSNLSIPKVFLLDWPQCIGEKRGGMENVRTDTVNLSSNLLDFRSDGQVAVAENRLAVLAGLADFDLGQSPIRSKG